MMLIFYYKIEKGKDKELDKLYRFCLKYFFPIIMLCFLSSYLYWFLYVIILIIMKKYKI